MLRIDGGESFSFPPVAPAPPTAQEVAAAYRVIAAQLNGAAPTSQRMAAAVNAASAYRRISGQAIAEAAVLVQTQYNEEQRAASALHGRSAPPAAFALAEQQVGSLQGRGNQPLIDPVTLMNADHALQNGQLPEAPNPERRQLQPGAVLLHSESARSA